jgi:hypothetical protein
MLNSLICEEGVAAGLTVTAGAGMSVNIAAGSAYIQGDVSAEEGMYWVRSTAVENRLIQPADPVDNRNDIVVARINPDCTWSIVVITGAPSPPPAPIPPTPANSVLLAVIAVPAGAATPTVSSGATQAQICFDLIGEDTGWVTGTIGFAANWTNVNTAYRKRNNWVQLDIQATYTGATVPSNSTGNIPDIPLILTTPLEARPQHQRIPSQFVATSPGNLILNVNGTCDITHLYPNGSLNNGATLIASLGYWNF